MYLLTLNNLIQDVHLGCGAAERAHSQKVGFDLQIEFKELPPGAQTDRLEDTICYERLSGIINNVCKSEYHLLEKLAWKTFNELQKNLPPDVSLGLKAHKIKPPIPQLQGGTSFILGSWKNL